MIASEVIHYLEDRLIEILSDYEAMRSSHGKLLLNNGVRITLKNKIPRTSSKRAKKPKKPEAQFVIRLVFIANYTDKTRSMELNVPHHGQAFAFYKDVIDAVEIDENLLKSRIETVKKFSEEAYQYMENMETEREAMRARIRELIHRIDPEKEVIKSTVSEGVQMNAGDMVIRMREDGESYHLTMSGHIGEPDFCIFYGNIIAVMEHREIKLPYQSSAQSTSSSV